MGMTSASARKEGLSRAATMQLFLLIDSTPNQARSDALGADPMPYSRARAGEWFWNSGWLHGGLPRIHVPAANGLAWTEPNKGDQARRWGDFSLGNSSFDGRTRWVQAERTRAQRSDVAAGSAVSAATSYFRKGDRT